MLFSFSRRETSRLLSQRYLPNCLPTTRHKKASSLSAQEEAQRLDWTTIPKNEQVETQRFLGHDLSQAEVQDTRLNRSFGTSLNSNEEAAGRTTESQNQSRRGNHEYEAIAASRSQENSYAAVATVRRSSIPNERVRERVAFIRSNAGPLTAIDEQTDWNHPGHGLSRNVQDSVVQNFHEDDSRIDSSLPDQLEGNQTTKWTADSEHSVPISERLSVLRKVMASRNPTALIKHMEQASDDLELMSAIPAVTFIELLRGLHPEDEFLPLRAEYNGQGPKHYRMFSGRRQNFYEMLSNRRLLYQHIASKRIASGRTLGIGEYTQLMNLARATWDGPMALNVMKSMTASHVLPNLTCYNHYFEARGWSDNYHPDKMHTLRVIPHSIAMRKKTWRLLAKDGIKMTGQGEEEEGIRWDITRMFTKMVNDGINADTRAYCSLIIAQAREGDVRAMKSVLSRIWRVDTDSLLTGRPDPHENKLSKDSPTYPTKDLLYTLAHAFGSNNDMLVAMRLVDHFSRKYDLTIPPKVWEELMTWSFVLSTRRVKARLHDGAATGKLPPQSVENLWLVMRGPSYNSEPTLAMYDYLLRSFARRDGDNLFEFLHFMREGIKFHERASAAHKAAYQELVATLTQDTECDPDSIDLLRHKVDEARSERWFTYVMVCKWFKLLLVNPRWLKNEEDREVQWSRRILPQVVREFWQYKSGLGISYPIAGGRVELIDPEDPRRHTSWQPLSRMGTEKRIPVETPGLEAKRSTELELWKKKEQKVPEEEKGKDEKAGAEQSVEDLCRELDDL